MDIGPVELMVLTFPGERADPRVVEAISEVVSQGYVTVLDLVYLSRLHDGQIRVTDVDQDLSDTGLGQLQVTAQALVSEDDLEVVRDSLEPGNSAAVVVYEETWARRVSSVVRTRAAKSRCTSRFPATTSRPRCARREPRRNRPRLNVTASTPRRTANGHSITFVAAATR